MHGFITATVMSHMDTRWLQDLCPNDEISFHRPVPNEDGDILTLTSKGLTLDRCVQHYMHDNNAFHLWPTTYGYTDLIFIVVL